MDMTVLVQQYKDWLKNPASVDEKTAAAFAEIKKATNESVHVYQVEKLPYGN